MYTKEKLTTEIYHLANLGIRKAPNCLRTELILKREAEMHGAL
jgi:hypothetical protein